MRMGILTLTKWLLDLTVGLEIWEYSTKTSKLNQSCIPWSSSQPFPGGLPYISDGEIGIMSFHPKHLKWDQNLQFTSLSETTSIPVILCGSSLREPSVTHHDTLKRHLLIRKIYCASGVRHSVKASIHGIFLDMLIAIRGCSWMLTRIKTGTGLRFSNAPSTLQTRSHVLKSESKLDLPQVNLTSFSFTTESVWSEIFVGRRTFSKLYPLTSGFCFATW